jgi:hypothetical protein
MTSPAGREGALPLDPPDELPAAEPDDPADGGAAPRADDPGHRAVDELPPPDEVPPSPS